MKVAKWAYGWMLVGVMLVALAGCENLEPVTQMCAGRTTTAPDGSVTCVGLPRPSDQ